MERCDVLRENPKLFASSDKSEIGGLRLSSFSGLSASEMSEIANVPAYA